jgi:hypothetical protein
LVVDDSGNVYVTGESYEEIGIRDYVTVKYDASGNEVWELRYHGPENGWDAARDVAVDHSGNVYVTGFSDGASSGNDCVTIRYAHFLRGDVNQNWAIEAGDVVYLIGYLFRNGPPPIPILQAGDANCDGVVEAADVIYLINYLFRDGDPPGCD